jgi:hypothetical protein
MTRPVLLLRSLRIGGCGIKSSAISKKEERICIIIEVFHRADVEVLQVVIVKWGEVKIMQWEGEEGGWIVAQRWAIIGFEVKRREVSNS